MAFPLLLFLIFASVRLGSSLGAVSYSWVVPRGVVAEALLIGLFTSFYPARLIRAQLVVLRSAEFVEASHMIGASDNRIMWRNLLPHLVPTLLVWGAVAAGTNILLEVGLSFIGAGVPVGAPTLGSLLSTSWGTVSSPHPYNGAYFTPWQTIFPTAAILITVVSLNQLSEGVRARDRAVVAAMSRVLSYMARRLLAGLLTLMLVIALTFAVYWALPTQPANFVYPDAPSLSDRQIAHARHLLGLDRPKIVQYGDYLSHLFRGDLGHQWAGTKLIEDRTALSTADRRGPLSRSAHHAVDHPRRRLTRAAVRHTARDVHRQPGRLVERPHDLTRRAARHLHAPDGRRPASSKAPSGTCARFASPATARSWRARTPSAAG